MWERNERWREKCYVDVCKETWLCGDRDFQKGVFQAEVTEKVTIRKVCVSLFTLQIEESRSHCICGFLHTLEAALKQALQKATSSI